MGIIIGIIGGGLGVFSSLFLWISKSRESDINLGNMIALLNSNLNHTNELLNRDIAQLRSDITENREQIRKSATRAGKRISNTRTILLKLINYLNSQKDIGFQFVDVEEVED